MQDFVVVFKHASYESPDQLVRMGMLILSFAIHKYGIRTFFCDEHKIKYFPNVCPVVFTLLLYELINPCHAE